MTEIERQILREIDRALETKELDPYFFAGVILGMRRAQKIYETL